MANPQDVCIGIDLGTTYSCVGVWEGDKVTIIANKFGNRTTPSTVAFTDTERLVGEAAKSQAIRNPQNTIYDAKRLIGRKLSDATIQSDVPLWPFKVTETAGGNICVQVTYKGETVQQTPEEISAAILQSMKWAAEEYLGFPVTKAVITVPAYFNDAQRSATKDAGAIAGLHVERIVNEPTAAALAYGLEQVKGDAPSNIMIFDLGGGTLDVTVLTIENGVFEVLATCGNTHLGGQDVDNRLVDFFATEFQKKHQSDCTQNAKALRKLKEKAQEAKHILSLNSKATVEIDSLFEGTDFDCSVTRQQFNELNEDLFKACLVPVDQALQDANLEKSQIDEIVLIGGSTRIVEIQRMLEEYFGGKQLSKRINPDEAVAYGAAILGGRLCQGQQSETLKDVTLLDVTPLSLGIELANGKMSVLIPRNTSVPYTHSKIYRNNEDNQTVANIDVFEGEDQMAKNNRFLGNFQLTGLPQRKRGEVQVNVSFSINTNGILEVTGEVRDAQISNQIVIKQNRVCKAGMRENWDNLRKNKWPKWLMMPNNLKKSTKTRSNTAGTTRIVFLFI
eukprot:Phypoly_transcript_05306.p1 GENE.Phypoly_transcript_05306~~Phypoly_transcript_05306.p1  ORF type:complete len:562 (+),score=82.85 Phypoly_transcript_05306:52-1737(+)